jgi:hypothetical protein
MIMMLMTKITVYFSVFLCVSVFVMSSLCLSVWKYIECYSIEVC